MSTSSAYSSNKLNQILTNKTQHFIIKSFLTAAFEFNRQKVEYHLYWYNKNSGVDLETFRYKNMSNKKMNKKEISLFQSLQDNYEEEINGEDGIVWVNKELGFDKTLVLLNIEF